MDQSELRSELQFPNKIHQSDVRSSISLLILTTILTISFLHVVMADTAEDRAALLLLRSSLRGRTLLWNSSNPSHCSWAGVYCHNQRVSELRLPGASLSGNLPVGIFSSFNQLRTLSLRLNSLTGTIPVDIASCTLLRNLYLQGNFLSGKIPSELFTLTNLVRLNLARNNFSGIISSGFNNLTRLDTLYLEMNQIGGDIPDLIIRPSQLNFSFNRLQGSIPSAFSAINSSVFLGNFLCGAPLLPCEVNRGGNGGRKLSTGAVVGIVVGSVIGVVVIVCFLLLLIYRVRRKKDTGVGIQPEKGGNVETAQSGGDRMGGGVVKGGSGKSGGKSNGVKNLVFLRNVGKSFDLEDLLRASAEVLGKGTCGTTYKASFDAGLGVAVKRLRDVDTSEKDFKDKMAAMGSLDHENLVPLTAFYYSDDEKLLVQDYMPTGSLSALLHGNVGGGRTPLDWETRSNIALGAARAIEHLHLHGPKSSHGNIKSSNILLTKSYEARVSDFGLSHICSGSSSMGRYTGYRAPEVTDTRKVSQKADVYSFGVVVLELLTRRAPVHAVGSGEEGVELPRWVQSVVREEWTSEVFDLELLRYQNSAEEMVRLLQLAVDCTSHYPDKRPTMTQVVEHIQDVSLVTTQKGEASHHHT